MAQPSAYDELATIPAATTAAGSDTVLLANQSKQISVDNLLASMLSEADDAAAATTTDKVLLGTGELLALSSIKRVFDVKDYGATGDGVTNDRPAIQAAIDALPAAGGTIYFPDGIYAIPSLIEVDKPVTFVGSGGATIYRLLGGYMFKALSSDVHWKDLKFQGDSGVSGRWLLAADIANASKQSLTNWTWENCTFDRVLLELSSCYRLIAGGDPDETGSDVVGGIRIERCRFINSASDYTLSLYGVTDAVVNACHFQDVGESASSGDAIKVTGYSTNVVVTNCYFKNIARDALDCYTSSRVTFSHNVVDTCGGLGVDSKWEGGATELGETGRHIFSHNRIENCTAAGISASTSGCVVEGNQIESCGEGIRCNNGTNTGEDLSTRMTQYCTFGQNVVRDSGTYGLIVYGSNHLLAGNIITGCTCGIYVLATNVRSVGNRTTGNTTNYDTTTDYSPTLESVGDTEAVAVGAGTPYTTGVAAVEYGDKTLHRTVLTLTNVAMTVSNGGTGHPGRSTVKIYDWPKGALRIQGFSADLTFTKGGAGISDTFNGDFSFGTAGTYNDDYLLGANVELLPKTPMVQAVAGVATGRGVSTECDGRVFNGTTTAKDLVLNILIDDADISTSDTLAVNGTVTVLWTSLGTAELAADWNMRSSLKVFNARDFGAMGDGTADDTAALQAAITAAYNNTLVIPAGNYKTTSQLTIADGIKIDGSHATIKPAHDGIAVLCAHGTQPRFGLSYSTPLILDFAIDKNTRDMAVGSVGLKLVNANASDIHLRGVYGFEQGLLLYAGLNNAVAGGCCYNAIHLGRVVDNTYGVTCTHADDGWTNENTFYGGQFGGKAVAANPYTLTGSKHIRCIGTVGVVMDSNVFIRPSCEGYLDIGLYFEYASNCGAISPRLELPNSETGKVVFGTGSGNCYINDPLDCSPAEIVDSGGRNTVRFITADSQLGIASAGRVWLFAKPDVAFQTSSSYEMLPVGGKGYVSTSGAGDVTFSLQKSHFMRINPTGTAVIRLSDDPDDLLGLPITIDVVQPAGGAAVTFGAEFDVAGFRNPTVRANGRDIYQALFEPNTGKWLLVSHGALGESIDRGSPASAAITAGEYGDSALHRTRLTITNLSITVTDGGAGHVGRGNVKLYDFPAGAIRLLGATASLTLTKGAGGMVADWDGDFALGTAAQGADDDLTGTDQNVIPKTATTQAVAGVGAAKGLSTVTEDAVHDGTSTAVDLYLNVIVDDADIASSDTLAAAGTVTILWSNLGDY